MIDYLNKSEKNPTVLSFIFFTMLHKHLWLIFSLFTIVQMFTIDNNLDEYQRYQRGFGNRRSLGTRLKPHYNLKDILFGVDHQDNLRDEKHLFSNPYESVEQNDIIQQQQHPPSIYR